MEENKASLENSLKNRMKSVAKLNELLGLVANFG